MNAARVSFYSPDTLNPAVPVLPSFLARIVAPPTFRAVTRPLLSEAFPTLATDLGVASHFTTLVRSKTDPPEKYPVAVTCRVPPMTTVTDAGSTTIEFKISGVTVSDVVPDAAGRVAVTVVVP